MILFCSFQGEALTLVESYETSLQSTARIKEKMLNEQVAKQEKRQYISALLPSLSATSTHLWRDQANVGAFGQGYQKSSYLTLSQPLFQGGAEYSAYKIAKKLPEIAKLQTRQEKIELYGEIGEVFFEILRLERDQQTYEAQLKALKSRVNQLSNRAKIGRSRTTEVLAARTQMARVVGAQAQAENDLHSKRQEFSKLTGVPFDSPLTDTFNVEQMNVPESWQSQLRQTPQIKVAELLLEQSRREISSARAEYLPKLDLDSNYYLDRDGILTDSKWDVTVQATWNIYNGGSDYSEAKKKDLEMRNLQNYLVEQKNHLVQDFVVLKKEFLSQKNVMLKLQKAKTLSQQNYKQHVKEAKQGLVSQLEVLRVLEESIQAQQVFDAQEFETKKAYVQLQVLAGDVP